MNLDDKKKDRGVNRNSNEASAAYYDKPAVMNNYNTMRCTMSYLRRRQDILLQ